MLCEKDKIEFDHCLFIFCFVLFCGLTFWFLNVCVSPLSGLDWLLLFAKVLRTHATPRHSRHFNRIASSQRACAFVCAKESSRGGVRVKNHLLLFYTFTNGFVPLREVAAWGAAAEPLWWWW